MQITWICIEHRSTGLDDATEPHGRQRTRRRRRPHWWRHIDMDVIIRGRIWWRQRPEFPIYELERRAAGPSCDARRMGLLAVGFVRSTGGRHQLGDGRRQLDRHLVVHHRAKHTTTVKLFHCIACCQRSSDRYVCHGFELTVLYKYGPMWGKYMNILSSMST